MPRARRALELFVGLSATAALVTATVGAPEARAQSHLHNASVMAEGGEGGEGGEAGQAAAVTDLDVLVVLAQMQGHLLIAQELLLQRQFSAAEPHVGHPVDELYGALAPALQQRQIPPFLNTLEELRQQVRLRPEAPTTAGQLAKAQQAIAAAAQAIDGAATPPTVAAVVRQLADTAVQEYAAAVAGDQIVERIEYQDARGFLLEAQRLLEQAMAGETRGAAPPLKALQEGISAMLDATPTAMPPTQARLSLGQLQQLQQGL